LTLFLESWEIWLRWKTAFHNKTLLPIDSHPALAGDRSRHEELDKLLEEKLTINPMEGFEAEGKFRYENDSAVSRDRQELLDVKWSARKERRS
jgi:hypothetical protein